MVSIYFYDADIFAVFLLGCFTVHMPKAVKGEPFPDLDMLTKLLAPPGAKHAKSPLIEVLGENE